MPTIVSDTEDINPSGGDISITEPASVAVGDLLLVTLNAATPTSHPNNITGFTSLGVYDSTLGGFTSMCRDTYRVADGTEGPTYASTVPGTGFYSTGKMLRITGAHPTNPVQNWGAIDGNDGSDPRILPTVIATGPCVAVCFICGGQTITAGPSGWTLYEIWDGTQGVYYKDVSGAGSVGGESFTLSGASNWNTSITLINPPPVEVTAAGSGNSTTSAATLAFNCGAAFAVGDVIVVAIAADNNGTNGVTSLTSVTDAKSHTYQLLQATYDPGVAAAGQTLGLAWATVTTAMITTDQITLNFSPNTAAKAAVVWKLHPGTGITIQKVTSGFGAGSATGTPSITSSTINIGDVIIAALAVETNAAVTADADTTNGSWTTQATATGSTGTVATSSRIASQAKIVTATATQTYNPTLTSADCIDGWVSFTPAFIRPNVQVRPSAAVHQAANW